MFSPNVCCSTDALLKDVGTTMQTTLTNSLENWLMYMIFVLGFVIEVV